MPKTPTPDLETDTVREPRPAPEKTDERLLVVITKFGEGQVSTGDHVAGEGDVYAKRGDKMQVSPRVAASLEARGLAEIEE